MTFPEIRQKLEKKMAGIAGCGGLGSNCAAALVRSGIGGLVLVDFDIITGSNLNRQYYFRHQIGQKKVFALRDTLQKINPDICLKVYDLKLTPDHLQECFSMCDVLVEAFDLAEEKEMLIEAALTQFPSKPLVTGIGMAGWGNNDSLHVRRSGNLYICGDEASEIAADNPPFAPRVGIVAHMQANVVVEILLSEG